MTRLGPLVLPWSGGCSPGWHGALQPYPRPWRVRSARWPHAPNRAADTPCTHPARREAHVCSQLGCAPCSEVRLRACTRHQPTRCRGSCSAPLRALFQSSKADCMLPISLDATFTCRSRVPKYIPDFREAFDHFCLHAGGWMGGQGIRGQGCRPPASVQLRHSPGPPGILSLACGLNLAPAFPCNLCTTPMHRAGGRGVVEGLSKQLGLTPRQMEPSANTLHWWVVGLWWASGVKRASTRCFSGGSQRACARHTVPCLTSRPEAQLACASIPAVGWHAAPCRHAALQLALPMVSLLEPESTPMHAALPGLRRITAACASHLHACHPR